MKRILPAALLALLIAACQPADRDATPTLDTIDSGAPLYPGGVEPSEPEDEIEDEGR